MKQIISVCFSLNRLSHFATNPPFLYKLLLFLICRDFREEKEIDNYLI